MKLKVTYTNFNVAVPRQVNRVYKVIPLGLPQGITADLFTQAGSLIGSTAAGTPVEVVDTGSSDGDVLTKDSTKVHHVAWKKPTGGNSASVLQVQVFS